MQLKKIQASIAAYTEWLERGGERTQQNLYKWESQRIWQENWNLEASDLVTMYDQSLENSTTRRIWNRENYEPKRMMKAFAAMQPHFVRSMFEELFDETKEVDNRIDRFVFYCDELLREYKETHRSSIENNHYHDYTMISYYLAFQYPDQYTPYHFDTFQHTLQVIGGKEIPTGNDLPRYFKVMKTLFNFLKKDSTLLDLHTKRLEKQHFQGDSLLLVEDFSLFLQSSKKINNSL